MIQEIHENKKDFLPLLLLGDEQESMIDRYLDRGRLFIRFRQETPICCALVTDEGDGICELKNIAVAPAFQRKGIGSEMLAFLTEKLQADFHTLLVGTGESPLTLPFYEQNGFTYHHRIRNFFTDNYDHPIVEAGVLLTDMIVLQKKL